MANSPKTPAEEILAWLDKVDELYPWKRHTDITKASAIIMRMLPALNGIYVRSERPDKEELDKNREIAIQALADCAAIIRGDKEK